MEGVTCDLKLDACGTSSLQTLQKKKKILYVLHHYDRKLDILNNQHQEEYMKGGSWKRSKILEEIPKLNKINQVPHGSSHHHCSFQRISGESR